MIEWKTADFIQLELAAVCRAQVMDKPSFDFQDSNQHSALVIGKKTKNPEDLKTDLIWHVTIC